VQAGRRTKLLRLRDEFIELLLFGELDTEISFVLGRNTFQVPHPVTLQKCHYLRLQIAQAKLADSGFSYGVAIDYIAACCNQESLVLRGLVDEKHAADRAKNAWAGMMANNIRGALAELPSVYEPQETKPSTTVRGSATQQAIAHCREVLEEAIPTMLRVYGVTRNQALDLPSWEFDLLFESAVKFRARESLDKFHMTAMAFGGKPEDIKATVSDLQRQAGYRGKEPKKVALPTEEELLLVAKQINLMDRRKVHYK